MDDGEKVDDLFVAPIDMSTVPEYFIYELSKTGISSFELARRFKTTEEKINTIIDGQLENAVLIDRITKQNNKRGTPMEIA